MASPFKKAKGEQAALKMALYGPAGSGKTFTSLLIAEGLGEHTGKRVAFVDTEHGTDFYAQAVDTRQLHPKEFDFDAIYTRSLMDTVKGVKSLDAKDYGVIVIDSITHLWEAAIAAYNGKKTSVGTIPMWAWGKIKAPYKELMNYLLNCPMHVLICGRQGNEWEDDAETGELKRVGFKMKAEGETAYEPHILIRMSQHKKKVGIADIEAFVEKDRTGVLAGQTIINPTFNTLAKPILPLLGGKQAKMESTDEAAGRDAEVLAEQDLAKEANSLELLEDFKARLQLCKTPKDLKELDNPIKEHKKKMTTNHVAQLREAYLETRHKVDN